jgi:hypothetical protein
MHYVINDVPENNCQIEDISLNRSHKHGRAIRIKGSSQNYTPTPKFVKEPMPRCTFQDLRKQVNGKYKKERQ